MTTVPFPSVPHAAGTGAAPSGQQATITVHLNKLPLLAGIDEAAIQKMAGALQVRTADKGQVILHKGGQAEHLLFLLSGRLQAVDITEDGREIGLSFLMVGDYFGELSVIDGLPRSATVVACEPSIYALLPREQALDLMHNNPLVAQRMFKRLAVGIRRASNFRTILGIPNAFQRVYALLDYLAQTGPGGLVVIERLPTQQEISIMVNTSRETVSRAIQALIQGGVVEKDLRRLIVRKPEVLREESTSIKPQIVQSRP
ncbi:MAG: Crp/Fnr family transcriptional regulator [Rhodoferax sp.]|nr:Crp/Fnr family transcriptional regulator [Rhodoferax sp.]MBP7492654.1 Crp/Fnr family transcriptional regulator [Rhodoferax sp.]